MEYLAVSIYIESCVGTCFRVYMMKVILSVHDEGY